MSVKTLDLRRILLLLNETDVLFFGILFMHCREKCEVKSTKNTVRDEQLC